MNEVLQSKDADKGLSLVQRALAGDRYARKDISNLVHPIIQTQCDRFCKRFCYDNRHQYRCSLLKPWGSVPAEAALCEWGNGSYAWMLNDLTRDARLQRFAGRHGSSLRHYLYVIANSLPFYERWKDWRFGRNVHVPAYIKEMAPLAAKIFLALRSEQDVLAIAQKLACQETIIEDLVHRIIIELTRRNRLHLLNPDKTYSLTQWDSEQETPVQADIADAGLDLEEIELQTHVQQAWRELSAVEQFVLEASIIEERDASVVLAALKKLNIAIAGGVAPEKTDRQQLYYFRRKTLAKLARILETKK